MNLFGKQKNIDRHLSDYKLFSDWLDKVLEQELPKEIIAFSFNLSEVGSDTYSIQLIGSDEFDKENEENDDWIYSNFFTSGEHICYIQNTKGIKHWSKFLDYVTELAEQYLQDGKNASILKGALAVGIDLKDFGTVVINPANY